MTKAELATLKVLLEKVRETSSALEDALVCLEVVMDNVSVEESENG
jgi:hypothetical protein